MDQNFGHKKGISNEKIYLVIKVEKKCTCHYVCVFNVFKSLVGM